MAKKIAKKLTPQAQIRLLTEEVRNLRIDLSRQREYAKDADGRHRELRQQTEGFREQLRDAVERATQSAEMALRTIEGISEMTRASAEMQTTICEVLKRLVPDPTAAK